MKSIEKFLDHVVWLFYGLIPALYLSIQSSVFSYKYRLFPDFIFVYVLAIIFVLIIFLIFRMFSKYHDLKKGKSTIFSTIFSYFSFPLLSSCVTAIFLFSEFKSVDRNAIFPYLFNYLLIQFFSWVLFIVIWYYKEEKRAIELAKFENTQETQSESSVNSTELQEEKAKNAQLQAENERLKAENAELKAQLQDNAQRQSAVDSDDFSIYGHKSELLEILFKVTAEFWADSETPPKNSVIEQWIETNYPVKDYPYVSKAVRQYIATILRPQPKLK